VVGSYQAYSAEPVACIELSGSEPWLVLELTQYTIRRDTIMHNVR